MDGNKKPELEEIKLPEGEEIKLGEVYEKHKIYAEKEDFEKTLNEKARTYLKKAKQLYEKEFFEEAIKYCDLSLESEPMKRETLYLKAKILTAIGKYDNAIDCYGKMEKIGNRFPDLIFVEESIYTCGKAFTLSKSGKNEIALNEINKIEEKLNKEMDKCMSIRKEYRIRDIDIEDGFDVSGLNYYQKDMGHYIKEIRDHNIEMMFLLDNIFNVHSIKGFILGKMKKYDEAISEYNKAIEIMLSYSVVYNQFKSFDSLFFRKIRYKINRKNLSEIINEIHLNKRIHQMVNLSNYSTDVCLQKINVKDECKMWYQRAITELINGKLEEGILCLKEATSLDIKGAIYKKFYENDFIDFKENEIKEVIENLRRC